MHALAYDTTINVGLEDIDTTSSENSFQTYIDEYRASTQINFTDFLKTKGFILDHVFCEGSSDQQSAFENAHMTPEKVTAICTIQGQKIYVIATKLPSIQEQVKETLNFVAEPRHPHCKQEKENIYRR